MPIPADALIEGYPKKRTRATVTYWCWTRGAAGFTSLSCQHHQRRLVGRLHRHLGHDMPRRSAVEVPANLRARLEVARLDLLALFRARDRMDLTPSEIPQRLIRQLFELDADYAADYAEALGALEQAPGTLEVKAMLRDTLAAASTRFRKSLPPPAQSICHDDCGSATIVALFQALKRFQGA